MTTDKESGEIINLRNYVCVGLLAYGIYRAYEGFYAVTPQDAQQAFGVAGIMVVSSAVVFVFWTWRRSAASKEANKPASQTDSGATSSKEEQ
ncbi:hypothetical protein [Blastopirellula retiformator]|uniref:Uncharacterized protein n=1 Tax=Blastopirellula retiformator TaxID=2527970 RepID=A0A5C5VJ47_9BACT|nr:hypothetical protein [Blastopirellula retiformator]TWT38616.1 hypothetical protein Enr8_03090 [Blastopirellula retiformator]